jgi:hypothetical protein
MFIIKPISSNMQILKSFLFLVVLACSTQPASAQQNSKEPSMADMMEQMRQLLSQFEQGGGMSFQFQDMFGGDSLSGGGLPFNLDSMQFSDPMFRTMPYREGQQGMMGMEELFKQFGDMGALGQLFGDFGQAMPQGDDGQSRTDEDLLPEEQMRQSEDGIGKTEPPTPTPAPKPRAKTQKAEPARKTTRI